MIDDKILNVTEDVKWIGVLDAYIKTFDIVMTTEYGTTYNSYFINADKKAIVESVKEKFWDIYIEKVLSVCEPNEIEYIFVNHTEPDHSGSIAKLLQLCPNAKIVGSGNAIRYLNDLFNYEVPAIVVKDGDTIDLGNKKMRIIGAPNLHWPDSIYSYLEEDKILFTCDSFGSHFCHPDMFDNKVGDFDDAFKYYFDVIIRPFGKFMIKAIEKIQPLDIKAICPGHGPILIENWKKYVELSKKYSEEFIKLPLTEKILIAYVSAYGKTGMIAEKIAEGIKAENVAFDLCDIEKMSLSELSEKIENASAIIIGSPTINQNILPPIYNIFALMTPLRDKGKLGGCFGSYGWSGEAKSLLPILISGLKLSMFEEGIFTKFTPSEADLQNAFLYGKRFAAKVKETNCPERN